MRKVENQLINQHKPKISGLKIHFPTILDYIVKKKKNYFYTLKPEFQENDYSIITPIICCFKVDKMLTSMCF